MGEIFIPQNNLKWAYIFFMNVTKSSKTSFFFGANTEYKKNIIVTFSLLSMNNLATYKFFFKECIQV